MKRIFLLAGLIVFLMIAPAAAAEVAADPVVFSLSSWYHAHPMPATPGITGETIFKSPRAAVIVRQAPAGTKAAAHYHNIADEMVYIVAGSAEMLIHGDWIKLTPGDVHMNPRGAVHALSVTDPQGCKFVSVFTPPQPAQGDATMIPAGEPLQSPAGLLDAAPGAGVVVKLKEWQGASSGQESLISNADSMPDYTDSDGLRGVTVIESPRSVLMLREAGYGASHGHKQDQADEISIVVSGSAHVSGGTIGQNDIQIVPMGTEHRMNLMLGENIRFITVFALPEKTVRTAPLK